MKFGIIGAGYVGRSLAGAGVKAGHDVMISNSRGPRTLFSECAILGCKAGTIDEAAKFGELVLIANPMKHFKAVPVGPLEGKIVIDTNNYYPGRDDAIAELDMDAKKVVADLYDEFGFDPVDVGALSEGWRFQTGTPVYCIRFNKDWLKRALAEANR